MDDKQYRRTKPPINSRITVVQNSDYKWGAIDEQGNVVIPFGKYAWIDGFQNGLAKVIGYNDSMSPNIVLRISWGADGSMTDDAPVAAQGIGTLKVKKSTRRLSSRSILHLPPRRKITRVNEHRVRTRCVTLHSNRKRTENLEVLG